MSWGLCRLRMLPGHRASRQRRMLRRSPLSRLLHPVCLCRGHTEPASAFMPLSPPVGLWHKRCNSLRGIVYLRGTRCLFHRSFSSSGECGSQLMVSLPRVRSNRGRTLPLSPVLINGGVAVAGLWRIVSTDTFGCIRPHRAPSLRGLAPLSMAVPTPGCLYMLFCRVRKLCLLPRKVIADFRFGNVRPSGFCIFFSTPSFFGVVKIRHKLALFLSSTLCRAA